MRRALVSWVAVLAVVFGVAACGDDGEDRPGEVTEEGTGTGSATGTGSGSGSGTGSGAHGEEAFSEDEADTVVHATGSDFKFEGIPASVQGPKVYFEFTNEGPSEHELEILGPDGEPVGEVEAMPAGEEGHLAVELEPGEYTAQCIVETPGGETHASLGMTQTFTVT